MLPLCANEKNCYKKDSSGAGFCLTALLTCINVSVVSGRTEIEVVPPFFEQEPLFYEIISPQVIFPVFFSVEQAHTFKSRLVTLINKSVVRLLSDDIDKLRAAIIIPAGRGCVFEDSGIIRVVQIKAYGLALKLRSGFVIMK